jgi:hypothetical protein
MELKPSQGFGYKYLAGYTYVTLPLVTDSKALGKVKVQPETLMLKSSSMGLDSWPPNNPQI